ncbi:MAG: collagen-like protein [Oscillospiraceae bacterium]|nr:collagen-like protein [Oscillospiraceae bacterium]
MKLFRKTLDMTVIIAVLVFLFIMPFISSCTKEVELPPEEVVETENAHETLFNILSSENGHSSNLSIQHIREFYIGGSSAALFEHLAESPMVAEANLTVSADRAIFGDDALYADFATTFLRDASLSIVSNRDPSTKTSFTNIGITLAGQKLAGADIYIDDGELFCLRSAELYPDYLGLNYPDLLNIVSDATDNAALSNMSYDNLFLVQEKYMDLLGLLYTDSELMDSVTGPLIDKLRDAIADENITIEYDVPADGMPGGAYKKVSVSLANDDLRQVLTALVQAAKENTALLTLIKGKYSVIYETIAELADIGANVDPQMLGLPPIEDVETFFQTSFAAFEVMLGASAGLPVKAMSFDLYLDETILKSVDIKAWTSLPEIRAGGGAVAGGAEGGAGAGGAVNTGDASNIGDQGNAGGDGSPGSQGGDDPAGADGADGSVNTAFPNSVYIINNAGEPDLHIGLKSFDDGEDRRLDSIIIMFAGDGGDKNTLSVVSVLSSEIADESGGTAVSSGRTAVSSGRTAVSSGKTGVIDFTLDGAAFNRNIPNTTLSYTWDDDNQSLSLYSRARDASGHETPLLHFQGELTVLQPADNGNAATFGISAELGMNDVDAFLAGQSTDAAAEATTGAASASAAEATSASASGSASESASGSATASETISGAASGAASNAAPAPGSADFTLSVRCEGQLQFGAADIPPLMEDEYYLLVQDSFYDGTFETIFNEFFTNLIRFASANRQLLSLYGFPGF